MVGRIIEVASDGVHLSTSRGFIKITKNNETLGQVAFDQIESLIVHGHGITFSSNLITSLSKRGIPLITCGSNHLPIAITWPVDGHYSQGFRMEAQAAAPLPLKKRIWKDLVKAKITNQALILTYFDLPAQRLYRLVSEVKTGDETNCEAQAAQYYWPKIMGEKFRRDRAAPGANQLLNYGYMILRAATARSIISNGLHPSLSIHHQSRGTAMRLADDLMEPFRPYVDFLVKLLLEDGQHELNKETKSRLAEIPKLDLKRENCVSPLQICLDSTAASLVALYNKENKNLELPVDLYLEAAE